MATTPDDPRAAPLLRALDARLLAMTGDSGASSFHAQTLEPGRSTFLIALGEDGEAVGCGALRPMDAAAVGSEGDAKTPLEGEAVGALAEIKRMYAADGTRGVGAALLAGLEQAAVAMGYRALRLSTRRVNERAVAFYRRHGFVEVAPFGAYVDRPTSICMGKPLQARLAGSESESESESGSGSGSQGPRAKGQGQRAEGRGQRAKGSSSR